MRTKKFEERIANKIAYTSGVWLDSLRMELINKIKFQRDVEYGGIKYQAFGQYELHLMDGTHIVHIGQQSGILDFYYFSINSDEASDECFDEFYEQSVAWTYLKRLSA